MTATAVAQNKVSILLVDDDEDHLLLLSRALRNAMQSDESDEFEIDTFTDPAEAMARLATLDFTIIVCDYNMPGGNGLEWLPDFIRAGAGPVILLTGQGDERIAARAFREGAADYLTKSNVLSDPDMLWRTIRESMRRERLEQCNNDLTRQLQAANRSLEKQNKTLCDLTDTAHRFVENVAHEFRTPLTVIREFASIMGDGIGGDVNDAQREYISYIIGATGDLAHLVDDFLDSGRLKSRTLRVDRSAHQPREVLDQTRTTIKAHAANKHINVVENIESDLSDVYIDLDKANRTLINLAINAIKFSSNNATVEITVAPTGNGDITFSVTDSGPGMPPEEVQMVFERFKQVGDVQRSPIKGFGLGLNIARELVWLNLGQMHVQSEKGVGSTFSFTVPVFDPAVIVERYLQNMPSTEGAARVSVLQCPVGNSATVEQVRARLASACYPTDIIIPAMDSSCVVLLGITDEPDKWMQRLHTCFASQRRDHNDDVPQIDLRWVGSWNHPDQEDAITTTAVGRCMGMATAG